jgi:hypothetical protein
MVGLGLLLAAWSSAEKRKIICQAEKEKHT